MEHVKKYVLFPKKTKELIMKSIQKQAYNKGINACNITMDCCFIENSMISIGGFINYIVSDDKNEKFEELRNRMIQIFRKNNSNTDGSSSSKIYSYCKRMVLQYCCADVHVSGE